jgi:hypothetical protein
MNCACSRDKRRKRRREPRLEVPLCQPAVKKLDRVRGLVPTLELYPRPLDVLSKLVIVSSKWAQETKSVVVQIRLAQQMRCPVVAIPETLSSCDAVHQVRGCLDHARGAGRPLTPLCRIFKGELDETTISQQMIFGPTVAVEYRLICLDNIAECWLPAQARRFIVFGIISCRQ